MIRVNDKQILHWLRMTAEIMIEMSSLDRIEAIRVFFDKQKDLNKCLAYVQNDFIPLIPEKNNQGIEDSQATNIA